MRTPDQSFAAAIDEYIKHQAWWLTEDDRQFLDRLLKEAIVEPSPHNKRVVESLVKARRKAKFMMTAPELAKEYSENLKNVRDALRVLRQECMAYPGPEPEPGYHALKQGLDWVDENWPLDDTEHNNIVSVEDVASDAEIMLPPPLKCSRQPNAANYFMRLMSDEMMRIFGDWCDSLVAHFNDVTFETDKATKPARVRSLRRYQMANSPKNKA